MITLIATGAWRLFSVVLKFNAERRRSTAAGGQGAAGAEDTSTEVGMAGGQHSQGYDI